MALPRVRYFEPLRFEYLSLRLPGGWRRIQMTHQTKLVTVKELSNYLRVHPSTIYRLLKEGELPGFKLGSDWRFNVEAIHRWRADQGEEMEDPRPEDLN